MRKLLLAIAFLTLAAPAQAASCFWVGGTGSITPANTANWASASGGTGGTCAAAGGVPATAGDTATIDTSSGGGTQTLNWGGTWTIGILNWSPTAATIFDNSVNNNNITFGSLNLSINTNARTWRCGTATYTVTTTGNLNTSPATGLTMTCGSESWVTQGSTTGTVTLTLGGITTFGNFTLGPASGQSGLTQIGGGATFKSLAIQMPQRLQIGSGTTLTVTQAVNWIGNATGQLLLDVTSGSPATISLTAGGTAQVISARSITFTGTALACANCAFSNVTGPSQTFASGGGGCILGGWLLWRDMPGHLNDNFPAWIERAG